MAKRVIVGKIDLDTVCTAYLCGLTRNDEVQTVRGTAPEADLADPKVICIEVGGSGQVELSNYDHHEAGGPEISATLQKYREINKYSEGCPDNSSHGTDTYCGNCGWDMIVEKMVNYVNQLDIEGPRAIPGYGNLEGFPYLSDVFAGMLLPERNPVEQLHKGVEMLKSVVGSRLDPYGTITGFDSYAEAKAENNRQMAKAVEAAQWTETKSGLKLGYLETEFFGAPGALYGNGAEVVVAFNPNFNGVRKFTVAGNNVSVEYAGQALNQLEPGWGGPPTGTIVGSPREGSKLSLEEVVDIVVRNI